MATTLRTSALLLAAAAALTLSACGGGDDKSKTGDQPAGASRQTVTAATATSVALPRVIVASGSVSAWEEVPVGAETGGLTAVGVYVDEGSYVRQGQVLVKLNDALLQAQLRQQQAAVQSAEANAARDDAALARAQELKQRGFLSQASLDTALANQRASQANLASARAALSEIRTRLSQAEIKAPVSGLIISRNVTKGQIVEAGTQLFRMVRDGRLELDAQVPETDLPALRAGQTATITSNEGVKTSGTIRIVTPEVDAQTRLGLARITLSPGSGLKPGMFARAAIDAGAQPTTVVPTGAVLYRENKAGVYVLNADNSAHFRPVTVLSRRDDQTSVSGVEPGVRVVVQGAGFLSEGDKVTVSTGQAAAAPAAAAPAKK
ncbi:RND family efflux transporter MFP subunit [Brevundimonas bullata]|uniref:RND family efflux transporter MFP subunit n=1 Tax=Brevundimonas bullata TaxID=13160 RepID=A0A7W7IQ24_9CAUL|nr:efflux RND transporter periplasmic adaptor subunit [Brevundimonas bullata]MBB4798397.1 RND family efflux transporter MFP subunit [Brevundimonas bullata]MBB6383289.1 RND family efflux transporter MFP subunit [Brevundimonas bullata]